MIREFFCTTLASVAPQGAVHAAGKLV